MTEYRKLKVAYRALLEGANLRSQQRYAKKIDANHKIKHAEVFVTGTGSHLGQPSISLVVSRGTRASTSTYCFNFDPWTELIVGKAFRKLRGIFFTKCSYQTQGNAICSFLSHEIINSSHAKGTLSVDGPPGHVQYLKMLYSHLLSPIVSDRFFSRVIMKDNNSDYKDENVCIRKIIYPQVGGASIMGRPTTSYICEIKDFSTPLLSEEDGVFHGDCQKHFVKGSFVDSAPKKRFYFSEGEEQQKLTKLSSRTILVLDCPTKQHLEYLQKNYELNSYFNISGGRTASIVAHITPQDLFSSQSYQNLIKNFGKTCKHIHLNGKDEPFYNSRNCKYIITFNKISNSLFPSIHPKNIYDVKQNKSDQLEATKGLAFTMRAGKEEFSYKNVIDKKKIDAIVAESEESFQYETEIIDKVQQELASVKDFHHEHYFPRLVVLGSGSMKSLEKRSQPAFLFMLDMDSSIILDCGMHTLEKLYLIFGEKVEDILSTIKLVFVSHKHLDHVAGFFSLLEKLVDVKERRKTQGKIICLMPQDLGIFYEDYLKQWEPLIYHNVEFCFAEYAWNKYGTNHDALLRIQETLGLEYLMPLPVNHSIKTYGIVFVTQCGKKILYTSDTLPMSRNVIKEGQNADLLIHDCLYVDDEWKMDANIRKHSYLSGVISTIDATNAKFTMLTHFHPSLPILPVPGIPEEYRDKMACAFDNLSISLSDLSKLPAFESAVHAIFRDSIEEHQHRYNVSKMQRKIFKQSVTNLYDIL